MLVISSDLHLTDGTSGNTIKTNAFEIFKWRLEDLAYAASCQKINGIETYEPIKDIYLVLLGDVLDTIRSTKWLGQAVRPWDVHDAKHSSELAQVVGEITDGILKENRPALEVFRSFKKDGLRVPTREEKARGEKRGTHPVAVHIFYVCGNHDWFYHLPGQDYDAIRARVIDALGLENPKRKDAVFPWDTDELAELKTVCRAHNVFGRHGDVFDSSNFEIPKDFSVAKNYKPIFRNNSSLGDAVVIELIDKFADDVNKKFDDVIRALRTQKDKDSFAEKVRPITDGLKEIDNVRPVETIPAWVEGLLARCDAEIAREVRKTWNDVVEAFLQLEFVRNHRGQAIKWGLRMTEGVSFAVLGRIVPKVKRALISAAEVSWLARKIASLVGIDDSLYACALTEPAYAEKDISYIVYGHSHQHEIVPLRTQTPELHKSAYLNSGTWRAVFEQTKEHPKNNEFFGFHVMTYLTFFTKEERGDHEFETWSGSLESPMIHSASRGVAKMVKAA